MSVLLVKFCLLVPSSISVLAAWKELANSFNKFKGLAAIGQGFRLGREEGDSMTKLKGAWSKKKVRATIYLFLIVITAVIATQFGVDKHIVALVALLVGIVTQAFTAALALLALIPWIGPFIANLLSIPLFWIINAVSNLLGTIAIKQGYGREIATSKLMVLVLTIGMIIGYLLGHWFPF